MRILFATSHVLVLAVCLLTFGLPNQALAQDATQSNAPQRTPLITEAVDESQLTLLAGNTHPLARAEYDLGSAPATLPMERMLLVLKRSPEQESALRRILDDQQDKTSPNYHNWLSPEEFGKQFGPTDVDMQTITLWLESHGFQVGTTKGRTVLEFSGSASQVQEAFHTTIHKYIVNGEQHWANSSDPSIPAALAPAVAGVASLHSFFSKPMNEYVGKYSMKTHQLDRAIPRYTISGCGSECYAVAPYDFATIYDVLPLWQAASPIDGTGQTIAIVGRTDLNPQSNDAATFWQLFGLNVPQNKLIITTNGPDPGLNGDEGEANIDVQWSGAVAPGAVINFVTSASTETEDGVDLSALYIVENNLAPVMSESYGECELGWGTTGNLMHSMLWQQASAQGITVMVASGDNSSAGCDSPGEPAQFGLNVSGNASTPYNIAVGGTDFNQYNNWSTYWNPNNNAINQVSAKSYIPETTWNDSCTNSLAKTLGFGSTPEAACNNPQMLNAGGVNSIGGSGGASNCTTNAQTLGSCSGGYAKPSWQSGTGVPNDGKRDLPDLSLFASNGFLNSFYVICLADDTGGCNLSALAGFGGTSVSSPAFAGIMALVNQKWGRQGNANYVLYNLAAQQPSAFHDVPSGSTISVPCVTGTANCKTGTSGDRYGILSLPNGTPAYNTGAKYDQATGLGSVDANVLVMNWNSVSLAQSVTTLSTTLGSPVTINHGQAFPFSASVKPQTGSGIPTGSIALEGSPSSATQGIAAFTLTSGNVSDATTNLLPGGTYDLTAHYPGDSAYGPSDSQPVNVTVNPEGSQIQLFLETFDWSGQPISGNTTSAQYGSPYYLRVNVENSSGHACSPQAASGATACPTGSVSLANNGIPVDAGTYALNNYGYFEDYQIQLPGGSNPVLASYSGDNSFSASTTTTPINITHATTTMTTPYVQSWGVGSDFVASVLVQAQSSGVAPTGTVTYYLNGSPLTGTATSYGSSPGSGTPPTVSMYSNFTSASDVFPTAGTYTITASYGGDSNYASSTSSPTQVTEKYPSPLLSLSTPAVTVAAGQPVTVSAIVDTRLKNVPVPTGPVPFINWGPMTSVPGNETYSTITDSDGNVALQASLTFVPTANFSITASYGGDQNYPAAAGGGLTDVSVTGSDFSLVPTGNSVTLSPGQQSGFQIFVQTQANYSGTINFSSASCSGLPGESSCVFSPSSLTGPGYTNLSVTTTAPHSSAQRSFSAGWVVSLWLPFAGLLLPTIRNRRKRVIFFAVLLGLLSLAVACGGGNSPTGGTGGGGGGGGTTDPGTPAGSYNVTLTATSGTLSHSFNFTLTVQ